MSKRFITSVLILAYVSFVVSQSYACVDDPPIPGITSEEYQDVPIGSVDFNGVGTEIPETGSYDPDNGSSYGGGHGINKYFWKYGDDPNDPNWHEDGGTPSHVYDTAGVYDVALFVVDDDNTPSDGNDYCEVWVYEVNEVVESGTLDSGPLFVCLNEEVSLLAIPYPNYPLYYPVDATIWEVNQPAGGNAVLEPDCNSLTTTLKNLTVGGEYIVTAKCGSNDPGAKITIYAFEVASLEPNDPNVTYTEFDDDDGDPNTRSFAIYVVDPNHEPNVVTVIATPNPDINEPNDLPACWTLTGGDGTDKLFRTVDRTVTGVTTLTCTCGDSSKTTKIYVVKLELGFKNSEMTTPKIIDPLVPPVDVRIGVILADSITFDAIVTPDVTLEDSDYSWTGEKTGDGPSISVTFDIIGNSRTESVTVLGVTRTATTTVIYVPPPTENEWGLINWSIVDTVISLNEEAETWAYNNRVVLGGGYGNGNADAARHAYWNVLMTIEISAQKAAEAGTAHEYSGLAAGQPHNQSVMDIENNKHGITIGLGLSDPNRTDCQNAVIEALNDETLTILDDLSNPNGEGLLKSNDPLPIP